MCLAIPHFQLATTGQQHGRRISRYSLAKICSMPTTQLPPARTRLLLMLHDLLRFVIFAVSHSDGSSALMSLIISIARLDFAFAAVSPFRFIISASALFRCSIFRDMPAYAAISISRS
jgi:hypothetical protein